MWWIYQRLERKQRKVIPSYVISATRKEFPEPDGDYTGFKDPLVIETDLAFIDLLHGYTIKIFPLVWNYRIVLQIKCRGTQSLKHHLKVNVFLFTFFPFTVKTHWGL